MTSLPSPDLTFSDTASQPDEQLVTYPKTSAASQQSNGSSPTDLHSADHMATPGGGGFERVEKTGLDARTKISASSGSTNSDTFE